MGGCRGGWEEGGWVMGGGGQPLKVDATRSAAAPRQVSIVDSCWTPEAGQVWDLVVVVSSGRSSSVVGGGGWWWTWWWTWWWLRRPLWRWRSRGKGMVVALSRVLPGCAHMSLSGGARRNTVTRTNRRFARSAVLAQRSSALSASFTNPCPSNVNRVSAHLARKVPQRCHRSL